MGYESWAPYVNMLFEDYAGGKHACQEWDGDKSDKGNYGEEREAERKLTCSSEVCTEKADKKTNARCSLYSYTYI